MKTTELKAQKFYKTMMGHFASRYYFKKVMDGYYANRLANRMISASEFKESDILVDVASGMGGFLIRLNREINFKHELTGIDLSPQMTTFFTERLRKEKISNIKVMEGSALRLCDFVDTATVIISNWMLKYLDEEDVDVFFKEVIKVLRPGGKFFVHEFAPGNKFFTRLFKSMGILRKHEQVSEALKKTGFVDIEETTYAKGHFFPLGQVSLKAVKKV